MKIGNMSKGGICFVLFLIVSLVTVNFPSIYAAETISAKSISFEETTIIEFINDGKIPVNTFRIWLGSDSNFKSFKTEKGWTGEKTPQGVIVFTTSEFVQPGESVKFGVKTDKPKPGINWKALDKEDKQLDIGKTLSGDLPVSTQTSIKTNPGTDGILSDSIFRIIPEKPNIGSTIRVTGSSFSPTQQLDLYLDDKKLESFATNDAGQFIITTKIPNVTADRVNFIVKDTSGNEKKISLRLGENENRIPETDIIKLTVSGIGSVIHRGDFIEVSGTAQPGSSVTAKVINPNGEVITTEPAEVSAKGNWNLKEPIIVPMDAPFGKYTAEISDGRETRVIDWTLESSKKIVIVPSELAYDRGEMMVFNGTGIPNKPIELILEDPLNKRIYSDIVDVDNTGNVQLQIKTNNDFAEGTYTLRAVQGEEIEFIYTGLGELPQTPINVSLSKLNYKTTESAEMIISGKPGDVVTLIIVDPSGKQKGAEEKITIGPEGRTKHTLALKGFTSGSYTAFVSRGNISNEEQFAVGLQTGSGEIQINVTKQEFEPGQQILALGKTNPNVLFELILMDPDGKEIKREQDVSDKEGRISNDLFRIPTNAKPGTWSLKAVSGANFNVVEFEVSAVQQEGMVIKVSKGTEIPGVGKAITIAVDGATPSTSTVINIINEKGEVVEKLERQATKDGKIQIPWTIPKQFPPGMYTFTANDAFDNAETKFTIE